MAKPNVVVGDDTGFIKAFTLPAAAVSRMGSQTPHRNVDLLRWAGRAEASEEEEIVAGLRNGTVECWNLQTNSLVCSWDCKPKEVKSNDYPLRGLSVLRKHHAGRRSLLVASETGQVQLLPFARDFAPADGEDGDGSDAKANADVPAARTWTVPGGLCRMRLEEGRERLYATGGKEHLLRVWDLETGKAVFRERNVSHDTLQLRQPVWINDLHFFPNEEDRLITCTSYGQLRVYDRRCGEKEPTISKVLQSFTAPSSLSTANRSSTNTLTVPPPEKIHKKTVRLWRRQEQAEGCVIRRAVMDLRVVDDQSLVTLAIAPNGWEVTCGDGMGLVYQVDLRNTGSSLGSFKASVAGAVRGIAYHPSEPLVACAGLDRYLRIFDTNTRKCVQKVYMKQKLNCLLFSTAPTDAKELAGKAKAATEDPAVAEAESDAIWADLEQKTAGAKKGTKRKEPSPSASADEAEDSSRSDAVGAEDRQDEDSQDDSDPEADESGSSGSEDASTPPPPPRTRGTRGQGKANSKAKAKAKAQAGKQTQQGRATKRARI